MNLRAVLEESFCRALSAVGMADAPALVRPSAKPQFGDYQANGCMAAAKKAGMNPRELAQKVVDAVEVDDLVEKLEIAGPGFINITLNTDWLAAQLAARLDDARLGVDAPASPQTVVVDYSSPNLAKEMHVGHLRSTIIGDALARVLEFIGHTVIRQNHVGDWGTQFGMLTAFLALQEHRAGREAEGAISAIVRLPDIEDFYRAAKKLFDADPEFAAMAREYVVKLQAGDERILAIWRHFWNLSWQHCVEVYRTLGINWRRWEEVRGESAYNKYLPKVIEHLRQHLGESGWFRESQDAQCVFLPEFHGKGPDGTDLPLIVQKSDGGYLYATTDLAGIWFRTGIGKAAEDEEHVDWSADRILYVTDSRQAMHFAMVFGVARAAGFVSEGVSLEHVPFGMMLGEDRRPFKTRTGGTVKLADLLKEAKVRAMAVVKEKNPDLSDERKDAIAVAVGIGAVKYADLSQNRASDYVFSWAKMLSFEGNTAPYMQYAYARVSSIFGKGGMTADDVSGNVTLAEQGERALGVKIAQFPETVEIVAADCMPNVLCAYLFDLATAFMSFYEACPVLKADDDATRNSRLVLCKLTAITIKQGLDLLGIETIEQM